MQTGSWSIRRRLAAGAVGALSLLLAGCFFAPGRFASRLDIHADHTFAFRYTGELIMIPLKEEADKASREANCQDEDSGQERPCTEDERAQKKAEAAASSPFDGKVARAMLGGLDPEDPETGRELAAKLRRRQGWNKVEYVGKGVFDVDYAVSGRMDHDFVFPVFEGFPMANAFVQITPRKDGTVRINAPTFGPDSSGSSASDMMASSPLGSEGKDSPTKLADGTFAIHTDGKVLANNTDEGPDVQGKETILTWAVNPRISAAPTALLQLAP